MGMGADRHKTGPYTEMSEGGPKAGRSTGRHETGPYANERGTGWIGRGQPLPYTTCSLA